MTVISAAVLAAAGLLWGPGAIVYGVGGLALSTFVGYWTEAEMKSVDRAMRDAIRRDKR